MAFPEHESKALPVLRPLCKNSTVPEAQEAVPGTPQRSKEASQKTQIVFATLLVIGVAAIGWATSTPMETAFEVTIFFESVFLCEICFAYFYLLATDFKGPLMILDFACIGLCVALIPAFVITDVPPLLWIPLPYSALGVCYVAHWHFKNVRQKLLRKAFARF